VASQPTYDPWAWIIWGREITQGALDTSLGPVVEAAAGAVHRRRSRSFGARRRRSCGW
jgi:hypothetical protein